MKVPSATATSAHHRRFFSTENPPVQRPCTASVYTVHVPRTSDLYVVWLSSGRREIEQDSGGRAGVAARRRRGPGGGDHPPAGSGAGRHAHGSVLAFQEQGR